MKRKTVISMLLAAICAVGFSSCELVKDFLGKGEEVVSVDSSAEKRATVEKTEGDLVAIRVLKTDGNEMLSDVMGYLQAMGELVYSKDASGMITGINGKENPADWSYCWMLYTSDTELSNNEWGSVEYEGEMLGSAMLGAESLPIAVGEIYVWSYVKLPK